MILDQVVQRIRDEWGQSQLSPELLRRIDGILDVNSVEHRVVAHYYREFKYYKTDILYIYIYIYIDHFIVAAYFITAIFRQYPKPR